MKTMSNFRPMQRIKQQVPHDECINILTTAKRGVLSVISDNGYPYAVPVNFFYDTNDGHIFIHGAKEGHKIDAIRKSPKVCFTVWNDGEKKDGDWAYYVTSVVVFGTAELIADEQLTARQTRNIGLKYYPTTAEVDAVMQRSIARVQLIAVSIDQMTGKLVHEK